MTLDAVRTRRRLLIVLVLTLLPWPAVWLGMYQLHSLIWTFVFYHGFCLLPAAVWGFPLWRHAVRLPNRAQWFVLAAALLIFLPLTPPAYGLVGHWFLRPDILTVVTRRGFESRWLLPLALYFVPVNAILEELFWRGVVLNELQGMKEAAWTAGALWTTATFGAWHYLVLRLLLRPGWAEATTLVIIGVGAFFAWLYRRTHSIIVPILWHGLLFDLALLLIFGIIVRAG